MLIEPQMLRSVSLFQFLDDDEIAELSVSVAEMTYQANQIIFSAGDPGGNMQIIHNGKVEIKITDDDGKDVVIQVLEKGDIFGELSLFDNEPRSATVIALELTTAFLIDRDDIEDLFNRRPSTAFNMLGILGKRLRNSDTLVRSRVARNVNEINDEKMTFGHRAADAMAFFVGSWKFLSIFTLVLFLWVVINTLFLKEPFDPYPFIFLNLVLSMMSAIQAPIIMMSQNRAEAKDRLRADLDYQINSKAELEIMQLHAKLDSLRIEINAFMRKNM